MNPCRPLLVSLSLVGAVATVVVCVACGADDPLAHATLFEPAPSLPPPRQEAPQTALREKVGELYSAILDATQGYAAFMCECEIAGTTETIEQCVWRTSPPIAPPIAECTQDVLGSDASSLPALECTAYARTAYLACLTESTCLDFEHQLDCQIEYITLSDCPSTPWDLEVRNRVECLGRLPPAEHECADGTKISADWVCDGEVDCPDASDEHGCHG